MLQDELVRSLLREAVAEESFDGDSVEAVARSAQRRRRQSVSARIAIGVLTVSLLTWGAVRVADRHDGGGAVATSAGVLRLAPSAMPGGLVLRAKTDTSAVRPPAGKSFTAIYRDGADRRVIVNGRSTDGPDSASTAEPRLGAELEDGFYVVARPASGVIVTVGTQGLDRDESLALAQTIRNVADLAPAAYQLDPLPKGFVLLAFADDHDLLFLDGTRSVYAPAGLPLSGVGPRIDIEIGRENPAAIEIDLVYARIGPAVTIRGHAATVVSPPVDEASPIRSMVRLYWLEQPGITVSITGIGVTLDDVIATARNLEPITEAQWAALTPTTNG